MPFTLTLTFASPASSSIRPVADHSCFDDFFIGIFRYFCDITLTAAPVSISIDTGYPLMHTFMSGLLFRSCMSLSSIPFSCDNSSSSSSSESNCTCFCIPACGFCCGFIHFLQTAAICPVFPQLWHCASLNLQLCG